VRIVELEVTDVRFPTSRQLAGSDAVHTDPDYSAAYVVLRTDGGDDAAGHGLTFTIGRGTEVVCAAVDALRPMVVGRDVEEVFGDTRAFSRRLTADSQLRWIGPEKGAVHLAAAAVVNAVWDLWARARGVPVWKLLASMSPAEIVDLVDFTYLTDALTPDEARDLLERAVPGRDEREAGLLAAGYPAYLTSAAWLGYDDERVARLTAEAVDAGWRWLKMKVGADIEADARRAKLIRDAVGDGVALAMDANQRWDVPEAIAAIAHLAPYDPLWIEEPTSPDDVLGHAAIARAVAPIPIATGEHAHNRVMFKQLLQAEAIGVCQVDACRLAGVNEVVAVLLLAAKFGVPVCPHAGGVGLCEYVQHISAFDHIAVSGSLEGRRAEYAEHLHEHFVHPVAVRAGHYVLPDAPGYSVEMRPESVAEFAFPNGGYWRSVE
jgi:L-fuconate dehydratase